MYVYVISAGEDRHKVGISKNPKSRLSELQTGHFEALRLVHVQAAENPRAIEQEVHTQLGYCRIRGEWFDCPESTAVAMVRAYIEGEPEDSVYDQFGGWRHSVGDVVECRKPAPVWLPGVKPEVGRFYTISQVTETGAVDIAECSNSRWWHSPCLFWPAFGRLFAAA
jgi:hypothetical protein